jgi:hypothetical protein
MAGLQNKQTKMVTLSIGIVFSQQQQKFGKTWHSTHTCMITEFILKLHPPPNNIGGKYKENYLKQNICMEKENIACLWTHVCIVFMLYVRNHNYCYEKYLFSFLLACFSWLSFQHFISIYFLLNTFIIHLIQSDSIWGFLGKNAMSSALPVIPTS